MKSLWTLSTPASFYFGTKLWFRFNLHLGIPQKRESFLLLLRFSKDCMIVEHPSAQTCELSHHDVISKSQNGRGGSCGRHSQLSFWSVWLFQASHTGSRLENLVMLAKVVSTVISPLSLPPQSSSNRRGS